MSRERKVQITRRAMHRWQIWCPWIAVIGIGLGTLGGLNAQSLTWLGTLGGNESDAWGVSANGMVVVGSAKNSSGYWRAFRWVRGQGIGDLGTLTGYSGSYAYSVSLDGTKVVGGSSGGVLPPEAEMYVGQAFYWTQATGMQPLSGLVESSNNTCWAYGISPDGTTIVGWAIYSHPTYPPIRRAVFWNGLGSSPCMLESLSFPSQAHESSAFATNGTITVGWAGQAYQGACLWNTSCFTSRTDIGSPGIAYGVSLNGEVVVGQNR